MNDKLLVQVGGEDWNLHTRGGGTQGLKTDQAELLSRLGGVPIAADDAELQAFLTGEEVLPTPEAMATPPQATEPARRLGPVEQAMAMARALKEME